MKAVENIQTEVKRTVLEKLSVPFLVFYSLLFMFFYTNGEAILGPQNFDKSVMTTYGLLFLFTAVAYLFHTRMTKKAVISPLLKTSLAVHVASLALGGLVTFVILFLVYEILLGFRVPAERQPIQENPVFWAVCVFQISIVAPTEELTFRVLWPSMIGGMLAQVAFGFFHWMAYGGDLNAIAFAVAIGMVWWMVVSAHRKYGFLNVSFAIGSHATLNIMAWLYSPLIVALLG